jgi:aminopeptidase N
VLSDDQADPALRAKALTLPDPKLIAEQQAVIDVVSTQGALEFARRELARVLREPLRATYDEQRTAGAYELSAAAISRRALKNICLHYLAAADDEDARTLCRVQFETADNMTDSMGALAALNDCSGAERAEALAEFYARWQHEELVLDKWLALQALSNRADTPATVRALLDHPAYDGRNPNRVRALIGNFALRNWAHFHAGTGASYEFVADQVVALDKFNPHLSSRIAHAFDRWRKFDSTRQAMQRAALERIAATANLSHNVREIVDKSLVDH